MAEIDRERIQRQPEGDFLVDEDAPGADMGAGFGEAEGGPDGDGADDGPGIEDAFRSGS